MDAGENDMQRIGVTEEEARNRGEMEADDLL